MIFCQAHVDDHVMIADVHSRLEDDRAADRQLRREAQLEAKQTQKRTKKKKQRRKRRVRFVVGT